MEWLKRSGFCLNGIAFVMALGIVLIASESFAEDHAFQNRTDLTIEDLPKSLADVVKASLEEDSYETVWQTNDGSSALAGHSGGYMAPNREQDYRTFFTPEGITLRQRIRKEHDWHCGIHLIGYGYEGSMQPVKEVKPITHGNRVEYPRDAVLTEWYINRPTGLEQGFTLLSPPERSADESGKLVFEFAVSGELNPECLNDGKSISFVKNDGQSVLSYSKLYAFDANDDEIPATMILRDGKLLLEIEDERAVYPITIDPVVQSETKLVAGVNDDYNTMINNTSYSEDYGNSVSISGDTVVVGNPQDDDGGDDNGSAYVYIKVGMGWVQQAKLLASQPYDGGMFGVDVAISGDTIVIGAKYSYGHTDPETGRWNDGLVYVFERSGTEWSEQAILMEEEYSFGTSVSISGDTIAVGVNPSSYTEEENWPDDSLPPGSAYVYVRNGNNWNKQATFTTTASPIRDLYAMDVSIAGNTLVVGAPSDDENIDDGGAAYVYTRSGESWSQQTKLIPADPTEGKDFGCSVSVCDDTIVVGAFHDEIGQNFTGSVYVFTRSGEMWSQQDKVTTTNANQNVRFGHSVAVSGDTVLVGAVCEEHITPYTVGSAYVFTRNGNTWTLQQQLSDFQTSGGSSSFFGHCVAVDGDQAVVAKKVSAVGVFERNGSSWKQMDTLIDGGHYESNRGRVSLSGNTLAIGAGYDGADQYSGAVYIYVKEGNQWNLQSILQPSDAQQNAHFGYSVSLDGDTLLVSSLDSGYSYLESYTGAAYIFVRNNGVWTQQTKLGSGNGGYGYSISLSGDTAVVGQPYSNNQKGCVYVYSRNGSSWSQQAELTPSSGIYGRVGKKVALSGNTLAVNGCYIFERSGNSWSQQVRISEINYSNIAMSGDILVGLVEDVFYLYERNGNDWIQQSALIDTNDEPEYLGSCDISISGDALLIGAPYNDDAATNAGSVYLFANSGNGWSLVEKFTASDTTTNPTGGPLSFGVHVSLLGETAAIASNAGTYVYELDIPVPPTPTPTNTHTPTQTHTPTKTFTPAPPTNTAPPSNTPTNTNTPTVTNTPTLTPTPSNTPTITPTPYAGEEITVQLNNLPTNAKPLQLVWLPPGTFTMGSPNSEEGRTEYEGPQHDVTITNGFYFGKYEITQAQWNALMGYKTEQNVGDDHPANRIPWSECELFLQKLNELGQGFFRLPTEAEWEYACRADTSTRYSWGDDPNNTEIANYAWYRDNSDFTIHEVGTKLPNPWGLFDLSGNVWEMCSDWFAPYTANAEVDPQNSGSDTYRISRGGSYSNEAAMCRSAFRNTSNLVGTAYTGIRIVKDVNPQPTSTPTTTPTNTNSPTATNTLTPTATFSPFPTGVDTPTPAPSPTATSTVPPTDTPTPVPVYTDTPSPTSTEVPTATPSPTTTPTNTPQATNTPRPGNHAPQIKVNPRDTFTVQMGERVQMSVMVTDEDGDAVQITLSADAPAQLESPVNLAGTYFANGILDTDVEGTFTFELIAYDGSDATRHEVKLTVLGAPTSTPIPIDSPTPRNTPRPGNHPPKINIEPVGPYTLLVGERKALSVFIIDADEDEVQVTYSEGAPAEEKLKSRMGNTTFVDLLLDTSSPGEYTFTVTADDGSHIDQAEIHFAVYTEYPTETPVPVSTPTAEPVNTDTPVPTETELPTAIPTNTLVPAETDTPVAIATLTVVPTFTLEPVITEIPTHTPSPTATATNTLTPTPGETSTPTFTSTPSPTSSHTPTPPPTATPGPTTPPDTVIVTDAPDTFEDLSGLKDYDADDQRALVIRWNVTLPDIEDYHVYVLVDSQLPYKYLTRTRSGNVTHLIWKANAGNVMGEFSDGPQFGHTYEFIVFAIRDQRVAGRFANKGAVEFLSEDMQPVETPTILVPDITNTPTPSPTVTPTLPPNSFFVADSLATYTDLSGGEDIDPPAKQELVLRWSFDFIDDVREYHIYMKADDSPLFIFLGRVGNAETNHFVWREGADSLGIDKSGPQDGRAYRFKLYAISKSGNPRFYGPFETGPVNYHIGEIEITPTPHGTMQPADTPTPTPTPRTASPVIITDNAQSTDDLTGGQDHDSNRNRALAVRWDLERANADPLNVSDVHVYVRVDQSQQWNFLGRTNDGMQTSFVWRPGASNISMLFRSGPQFGHSYQFRIYPIKKTGTPKIYGPYTTAGSVLYLPYITVTDNLLTQKDLSNAQDFDPADDTDLVIRWTFDSDDVDTTDLREFHIYTYRDGESTPRFLGAVRGANQSHFVWNVDAANLAAEFLDGPQVNHTYRFRVYPITSSGNPLFYGPYENAGAVELLPSL